MLTRVIGDKLIVPSTAQIVGLLNPSRVLDIDGRKFAVLPHEESTTKVLRNIGVDTPAPILSRYDWSESTPFASQKTTAAMLSMENRAYVLSTMGVGKTRAALFTFDWMRRYNNSAPALVIAPLSTLTTVWDREVFEIFPHMRTVVLHGTRAKRQQLLKTPGVDVFVINHDGVEVIAAELAAMHWGVVIVDEASAYSNARTARWKTLDSIVNPKGRLPLKVWAMTGSPTPDAPTDAYGIAKLVTPHSVPRSFRRFKLMTMTELSQFRWIARGDANDIVAAALKPSVRFTLDECHDIPETSMSTRSVPMSPKQKSLYDRMSQHLTAEVRGQEVTAINEAAKLMKLLQISAGFAYSDGTGVHIDSGPRLTELFEIIAQSEKKVLVFASFKWLVRALKVAISNRYTVEAITGDVSKGERDSIFAAFRGSANPRVIVAHAGTMAHGLNLIEASTIVWYGPTLSSELYEQANARIRRPGQTCKTHVIHIESSQAEKRAFSRLKHKQKMQGLLLELLGGVREE